MSRQSFDDLKCIWMSSGIVDYKLCDLQFDCDHCEFDNAMKNRQAPKQQRAGSLNSYFTDLREKVISIPNIEILTVLKNHLALRRIYKNSYMLGFSSFAWMMMGQDVTCSLEKGYLRKGDHSLRVDGDWGTVSVAIPFDTFVVSSFLPAGSSVQAGSWLGLIEADEDAVVENTLDYDSYKKSSLYSLEEMIGRYNIIEPFTTMNDGGNFVDALYKVTGKEHFRKIMHQILNP